MTVRKNIKIAMQEDFERWGVDIILSILFIIMFFPLIVGFGFAIYFIITNNFLMVTVSLLLGILLIFPFRWIMIGLFETAIEEREKENK